ncbi:hypothetical protein CCP3SC1AL1_3030003 [Gammaproteobacteria bacterium]
MDTRLIIIIIIVLILITVVSIVSFYNISGSITLPQDTVQPIPVNGKFSDWSIWSPCSAPCGDGQKSSMRIYTPAIHGGIDAPDKDITTRYEPCNIKDCPVNENIEQDEQDEQDEQEDNKDVVDDQIYQDYNIVHEDIDEYDDLEELEISEEKEQEHDTIKPIIVQSVTVKPAPVDGKFSDWSVWSPCSTPCGNGKKTSTRNYTPPINDGKDALDKNIINKEAVCKNMDCPVFTKTGPVTKENWYAWYPGTKFPDIPGVYSSGGKINRDSVNNLNNILENFNRWYEYAKRPNKITQDYKNKFRLNIVRMATKKSATKNKPWRFHFVLFYKAVVSYIGNVGFSSVFTPNEQVIVRDWLLTLTYAQLNSPKTNILVKPYKYWGNIVLQTISAVAELAILIDSDKLLEVCANVLKKQLTNGYIKDGEFKYMSLSDITRYDRSIGYTHSSLSWMIKIYKSLNKYKYARFGILEYRNILNNILSFYNTDVKNGAVLHSKKTGYIQSIKKGTLPLV